MLLEQEELPVGREVLNAKLSIVNDEICISGIHVMRGYLNNEAKNNECFIYLMKMVKELIELATTVSVKMEYSMF